MDSPCVGLVVVVDLAARGGCGFVFLCIICVTTTGLCVPLITRYNRYMITPITIRPAIAPTTPPATALLFKDEHRDGLAAGTGAGTVGGGGAGVAAAAVVWTGVVVGSMDMLAFTVNISEVVCLAVAAAEVVIITALVVEGTYVTTICVEAVLAYTDGG